jgi:acyl-CoA dehydrogenase
LCENEFLKISAHVGCGYSSLMTPGTLLHWPLDLLLRLLNPQNYESPQKDLQSKEIMEKTIGFFEDKGLESIKEDDQASWWYTDFMKFIKAGHIFSTLLTPAGYGAPDSRFDLSRVCEFNEISAFYSLSFQ